MSKHEESDDSPDESIQLNPADREGLDKVSESPAEDELFKGFDEKRRSFLKKLLVSAVYVTPAILSFSIRDSEARARKLPTRKERKQSRKQRKSNQSE